MNDQIAGICSVVGPHGACGHAFDSHAPFNGGTICHECARSWEGVNAGGEFHEFQGPRLAGGVYSPKAEQEAYRKAMESA